MGPSNDLPSIHTAVKSHFDPDGRPARAVTVTGTRFERGETRGAVRGGETDLDGSLHPPCRFCRPLCAAPLPARGRDTTTRWPVPSRAVLRKIYARFQTAAGAPSMQILSSLDCRLGRTEQLEYNRTPKRPQPFATHVANAILASRIGTPSTCHGRLRGPIAGSSRTSVERNSQSERTPQRGSCQLPCVGS